MMRLSDLGEAQRLSKEIADLHRRRKSFEKPAASVAGCCLIVTAMDNEDVKFWSHASDDLDVLGFEAVQSAVLGYFRAQINARVVRLKELGIEVDGVLD